MSSGRTRQEMPRLCGDGAPAASVVLLPVRRHPKLVGVVGCQSNEFGADGTAKRVPVHETRAPRHPAFYFSEYWPQVFERRSVRKAHFCTLRIYFRAFSWPKWPAAYGRDRVARGHNNEHECTPTQHPNLDSRARRLRSHIAQASCGSKAGELGAFYHNRAAHFGSVVYLSSREWL